MNGLKVFCSISFKQRERTNSLSQEKNDHRQFGQSPAKKPTVTTEIVINISTTFSWHCDADQCLNLEEKKKKDEDEGKTKFSTITINSGNNYVPAGQAGNTKKTRPEENALQMKQGSNSNHPQNASVSQNNNEKPVRFFMGNNNKTPIPLMF